MQPNDIKANLEELGMEPDMLDEVMAKIKEMPKEDDSKMKIDTVEALKVELTREKDWHARAKIAAQIISYGLGDY